MCEKYIFAYESDRSVILRGIQVHFLGENIHLSLSKTSHMIFSSKTDYFEEFASSRLLWICNKVCSVWTQELAQLEFLVIPRGVLGIMVTRQHEKFLQLTEIWKPHNLTDLKPKRPEISTEKVENSWFFRLPQAPENFSDGVWP